MRILLVATVVKTHIMEFHVPVLKAVKELGWNTAVAAKNDYEDADGCSIPYCDDYYDIPFARSPFSLRNVRAYKQLKTLIESGNFDVVHCHTPVGGVLARLAGRKARRSGTKIVYTAHGFHFYKGAPLINWIIYYPVEWLCARWTDVLITITKEDYELAVKHMHAGRVVYVPGVGIDVEKFAGTIIDRAEKRKEIGVPKDCFLILSVGELNKNKNHQLVIRALADLPANCHYAVAGQGELRDYLLNCAKELGVQDRFHLLGYRNDCNELYKAADLFVLPSFREGLNVSLMEAEASGLPCIASRIRGNEDIIAGAGGVTFYPSDLSSLENAFSIICDCGNREQLSSGRRFENQYSLLNVTGQIISCYSAED